MLSKLADLTLVCCFVPHLPEQNKGESHHHKSLLFELTTTRETKFCLNLFDALETSLLDHCLCLLYDILEHLGIVRTVEV